MSAEEQIRTQPEGRRPRCPARQFLFACVIDFLRRCRAGSAWQGSLNQRKHKEAVMKRERIHDRTHWHAGWRSPTHLARQARCSSAVALTKGQYSSQRADKSSHADFDYGRSGHEEGGSDLLLGLALLAQHLEGAEVFERVERRALHVLRLVFRYEGTATRQRHRNSARHFRSLVVRRYLILLLHLSLPLEPEGHQPAQRCPRGSDAPLSQHIGRPMDAEGRFGSRRSRRS